jgi:hypothetical protein
LFPAEREETFAPENKVKPWSRYLSAIKRSFSIANLKLGARNSWVTTS